MSVLAGSFLATSTSPQRAASRPAPPDGYLLNLSYLRLAFYRPALVPFTAAR